VSSKTGKRIRERNEKILNVFQEKTGKYFPHISRGFPNGYWKVEQEVKSLKKRKIEQPFMKWKEFEKEINRVTENSISSKEIEEIVKWMHRCGVLLHFSELTSETTIGTTQITEEIDSNRNLNPIEIEQEQQRSSSNPKEDSNHRKEDSNSIEYHFDPESLVILEPQWLANVFKKVIDHKRRNEIDQDQNGILTDEKLGELWKEYPLEIHRQLKEILEYFELAYSYRVVKEKESTLGSENNRNKKSTYWFFPTFLKSIEEPSMKSFQKVREDCLNLPNHSSSTNLDNGTTLVRNNNHIFSRIYEFHTEIPNGFFIRLIYRLCSELRGLEQILFWKEAIFLSKKGSIVLAIKKPHPNAKEKPDIQSWKEDAYMLRLKPFLYFTTISFIF